MKIFKPLPESLADQNVEQLTETLATLRSQCAKLAQNDAELAPPDEFSADAILDELTEGVAQVKRIEAELALRTEAEAEFNSRAAALAAEAGVELNAETDGDADGDADGEGDGDAEAAAVEPAAELATEPETPAEEPAAEVVASAAKPIRRPLSRRAPAPAVAAAEADGHTALVASAGLEAGGIRAGMELDREGLANAIITAAERTSAAPGSRVEVIVASAKWEAPPEQRLDSRDTAGNAIKIRNVVGPDAQAEFAAAGNVLCAPLTPIYDLPQISTEARPVRDSLPAFQADRGGITWGTPPSIADVTTAIGIITPEDEAEGGTFATKSCQLLECDEFNSATVASIFHCLEWGNLGARAWPERVAQFTDVVMAAWARLAETNLLNLISAGSTQVTAAQATYGYGALSNLTSQILVAAAGYRSRFRMSEDSRFVAMFPLWVRDLLLSDLINAQFDRFAINGYAGVEAFLRERGVNPVWYLDSEDSADSQIFPPQTAGALLAFPFPMKWFLFPIGTWIFLDTGTLELGIVRDSTLNAENEFQVFGESWESVAQVGYQSLEITSALCPSGTTAGPGTAITCA